MKSPALIPLAILIVALPSLAAAGDAPPPTLAVSYFDNNSGDASLEPLSRGLADMLITDLSGISALQIVERARLNDILKELDLSTSSFIDPETALKLGRGLAAAYILAGGYLVGGEEMRIDVRIFEVSTGKVLASDRVVGPKEDFFALQKDLVELLVKTIDVDLAPAERRQLRRNATESFEAFGHYSRGLVATDAGDQEAARAAFQAALDADPGYAAARDGMGRLKAIFEMGDRARASAFERQLAALDPESPTLAQEVNALFSQINMESGPAELRHRIELLTWLQRRDLEPVSPPLSPVPFQALALAYSVAEDPTMERGILGTCEYFITRYPNEVVVQNQCRGLVKQIEVYQRLGTTEERLAQLRADEESSRATYDAEHPINLRYDAAPAVRTLLRGYAEKAGK